jgi:heterotetrameric sarcosine oxidase gamma subunit
VSKPDANLVAVSRAPGFGEEGLPPGRHGPAGEAGVSLCETALDVVALTARGGQGEAVRKSIRASFAISLPPPGAFADVGGLTAIGAGPDAWRVSHQAGPPGILAARLKSAVGQAASIVDLGDGLATLELSGPAAREALARLCRLDLHPSRFQPGHAAETIMAQMPVMLWQIDAEPRYALAVPLTFAQSFAHALLEACRPFGCEIVPVQD